MATTIKQIEDAPVAYPDIGLDDSPAAVELSDAAAALDADMVWQRIESYVAHRWSERDAAWIVEGPGEWHPPLAPATISTVEVWSGADEWEAVELSPSPLGGYFLPASGPYRFSGTVGGGSPAPEVPAAVIEAFRRLAEYMAGKAGKQGATAENIQAGSITISHRRAAAWLAHAMANSGAGDLLRPYRRV